MKKLVSCTLLCRLLSTWLDHHWESQHSRWHPLRVPLPSPTPITTATTVTFLSCNHVDLFVYPTVPPLGNFLAPHHGILMGCESQALPPLSREWAKDLGGSLIGSIHLAKYLAQRWA